MKHILFRELQVPPLTVRETAATFNVTTRTVRRWIKQNLLDAVKIGGVVRIPRDRVEKLLEGGK